MNAGNVSLGTLIGNDRCIGSQAATKLAWTLAARSLACPARALKRMNSPSQAVDGDCYFPHKA